MILLADSGSTKCDWLCLDEDYKIVNELSTIGYNPYFYDSPEIIDNLLLNPELTECRYDVKEIWFYGSGCSSQFHQEIVHNALKVVFIKADIHVDHDLNGSAYAAYKGEPVISCILGTGSNSCYFDGNSLRTEKPSLGFILGDEGSGNNFGGQLLRAYFYKLLPDHLYKDFEETYHLSLLDFTKKLYDDPHPNVYLASFMRFISKRKEDPYFREMVLAGFREFLDIHVKCFPEHKSVKTHFIGSVGFHMQDLMKIAAEERGIQIGEFIKKPIHALHDYHLNHKEQSTVK